MNIGWRPTPNMTAFLVKSLNHLSLKKSRNLGIVVALMNLLLRVRALTWLDYIYSVQESDGKHDFDSCLPQRQRSGHRRRQFMEGKKERRKRNGDCKDPTLPEL